MCVCVGGGGGGGGGLVTWHKLLSMMKSPRSLNVVVPSTHE